MTPDNYIKHLEEIIIQLTTERDAGLQRIQELEKKKEELEKANEELKKRLRYYENPHTPPSARKLQKAKSSTEIIAPLKKAPSGQFRI